MGRECEYRVDELARLAGTTVRNVRAYQDRGLLPAPRRKGRIGLYAATHLARLRLIGELLSRSYTLANIGELIAGWEEGRELSELLGFEAALIGRGPDESIPSIGRADLAAYLGEAVSRALLDAATARGLLEVDGDRIRVDNPRMLEGGAVLAGAGVPVAEVLDLGVFLVGAVDEIAARYVEVIKGTVFPERSEPFGDADIGRLGDLVRRLRPLAKQVVDAELALALDRHLRAELGEPLSRGLPPFPGLPNSQETVTTPG
jgi:DNA-binding transcriptional MerR regulator